MKLRVVGAGLGRTGTASLKLALERLLGAPCHHMREVFAHPEQIPAWRAAVAGGRPDWEALLGGYAACVDWPAAAFWWELAEANPDAVVLLSVRDAAAWWESAHETIFQAIRRPPELGPALAEWSAMVNELMAERFTPDLEDRGACLAAFERHARAVREALAPPRLLEWTASDGWDPLCAALGVPVPDEPFPRINTREDWRAMARGPSPVARHEP